MQSFAINCPTQIRFGSGVSKDLTSVLPEGARVLLVRGASGQASESIAQDLARSGYSITDVAVAQEPSIASVNATYDQVHAAAPQGIVACGGGSVMDTAKALAFCLSQQQPLPSTLAEVDPVALEAPSPIPLIAVPTTAGTGAEVTSNAVLGFEGAKASLRGRALVPSAAFVDPELLVSAPKSVVLGSGLDAVVQTMEAYTSSYATPYTDALTAPNLRPGVQALRAVTEGRGDRAMWSQMAWTSLNSGLALSNGGLGAAHGLAAVLGGHLGAPHGMLCGRLLGPVLLTNRSRADIGSEVFKKIETCIETLSDLFPPQKSGHELTGFEAWLHSHEVPRLRAFGASVSEFERLAAAAASASSSTKSAVLLTPADFERILDAAY